MRNKGIAKFTAFCLAAGMTFGGNGIVAMATGTEMSLVGIGSTAKTVEAQASTEAATEAADTEADVTTDTTTDTTADATTEAVAETEAPAPLDTSMVGGVGFAQCEEYINIRGTADAENGEVLGKLYNNAVVYIEDVDANGWYKVKSGNVEGYVASQYITTGTQADTLAEEVGYTVASTGAEVLNVRASASQDSDIVTTVSNTQEVEVVEDLGDWLKVAVDADCYGYVSADYVATETHYSVAESAEEEAARLEAEYQAYLDQQAAAEAEYQAYLDQQEADAAYQAQVEADAAAQAQADAAYQAQVEADAQAQASADAQAQAEAEYQAYLDAQAQADAATQQADEQAAADAAAQAEAEYQAYLDAQAAADAQAQAEADAAAQAQAAADAQAQAEADAQAAADAQAQADANAAAEEYTSDDTTYTEDTTTEDTSSSSSLGAQIASYACQFVGNPYVWGGTSLTNGADCSGFTQSVMANFGISIPRTAASQSGSGTAVDLGSIQPGDLLFYYGDSGIGHVTMYIGNGQVVHASNSSTGIIISDYGYRSPACARRYW